MPIALYTGYYTIYKILQVKPEPLTPDHANPMGQESYHCTPKSILESKQHYGCKGNLVLFELFHLIIQIL